MTAQLIEVYLVEPGRGRPYFTYEEGALEFLPAGAPLPQVGDIILLPTNVTGDTEEQAFTFRGVWPGGVTPFRVVEREHLYMRDIGEEHDPSNTKSARYVKSWIFVRRVTQEEYAADPGQS